jgi:hypothetical protein
VPVNINLLPRRRYYNKLIFRLFALFVIIMVILLTWFTYDYFKLSQQVSMTQSAYNTIHTERMKLEQTNVSLHQNAGGANGSEALQLEHLPHDTMQVMDVIIRSLPEKSTISTFSLDQGKSIQMTIHAPSFRATSDFLFHLNQIHFIKTATIINVQAQKVSGQKATNYLASYHALIATVRP